MGRVNPQVLILEREVRYLTERIQRMQADPGDCPFLACDNSCVCATPTGMQTNGGCRCDDRKLRQAVTWWRRRAVFLQATIQNLRLDEPHPSTAAGRDGG